MIILALNLILDFKAEIIRFKVNIWSVSAVIALLYSKDSSPAGITCYVSDRLGISCTYSYSVRGAFDKQRVGICIPFDTEVNQRFGTLVDNNFRHSAVKSEAFSGCSVVIDFKYDMLVDCVVLN